MAGTKRLTWCGRKAVRKYPFDAAHPTCVPTSSNHRNPTQSVLALYSLAQKQTSPFNLRPKMLPSLFVVLLSGFTATALPLDDNFEIANGETIKDFKDQANSIHFCSKSLNIFLLQVARLQYWCVRRSATLLISSTRPSMSTRRDSQPKVCWNRNQFRFIQENTFLRRELAWPWPDPQSDQPRRLQVEDHLDRVWREEVSCCLRPV